jgi:hypothetical protein
LSVRQELLIPVKITVEDGNGFTIWAPRSIHSGRGDEVLELHVHEYASLIQRALRLLISWWAIKACVTSVE